MKLALCFEASKLVLSGGEARLSSVMIFCESAMVSSSSEGMENSDFSSPSSLNEYPHPTNFNLSNCVSTMLTSSNFLFREMEIMNMVVTYGLAGFLDGTTSPLQKTKSISMNDGSIDIIPNPVYESWKRSYRMLKGWITSILRNEV